MENEAQPLPQKQSFTWIWILAAVLLLYILSACCLLILGGAVYFLQARSTGMTTEIAPVAVTVPVLPSQATLAPTLVPIPTLDLNVEPLFGSDSLQRGFTPDPHVVQVTAGGDDSLMARECGLTTPAPTYGFKLSGGASETFLRIFFIPDRDTPTTLLVHTPTGDWLCANASSGKDPLLDIEFAPSGQYLLWVGTLDGGVTVPGSLSITQDRDVGP